MSSIDYSKLRSLTAKELVRALLRDGFTPAIRGEATTVIVILMVVVSRWLFLLLVILSFLRRLKA